MSSLVTEPRDLRFELARLAHEAGPGRRALVGLVQLFAVASDGAAAVYLRGEHGFRREASSGEPGLPEQAEAVGDDAGTLAFEGGLIAWKPARGLSELPPAATALLLAVAASARETLLATQLRREDFVAKTRGVQLEALYDVGLAIAGTLDLERLCEEILMRSVSLSDARRGALYLRVGDELRLDRAFGGDALPAVPPGAAPGEPLPGASYLLAVPIESDGQAKGLLAVGDKESRLGVGPFSDGDRRTLELLATQAAIALENAELHRQALEKERLEREMELAAEIQRQILPKGVPDVPGWELAGWNRPARHIGGDYFDLFHVREERSRLALVVGDVSGKGVPAALLVSTLHSALRLLLERLEVSPDLLARLNRHILESSASNKFITLFLGELDPVTGELVYLNAGHNPALVMRAGGTIEQLGPGGLPLGLLANASYRAERLVLGAGDLVCFYSDGITEASSPGDEEFGIDRLATLLGVEQGRPLAELVGAIDDAVVAFAAGQPQGDDQTIVLVRRSPSTGASGSA